MIRRTTWIVLLIFVVLVGIYWLVQRQPDDDAATGTPTVAPQLVFITGSDTIRAVRLEDSSGRMVQIEKDDQGTWSLTEPESGMADQERASTLVSQVSNLRSLAVVDTPPAPEVVGLAAPAYTLTITTIDGGRQLAKIGSLTPTSSGYYVEPGGGPLMVIAKGTIDALVENLDDPPIAPTPTVEPTPAIADPSLEPTRTPLP
jgi:hypothetical protein